VLFTANEEKSINNFGQYKTDKGGYTFILRVGFEPSMTDYELKNSVGKAVTALAISRELLF
jgi:hypothetical protein